MGVMSAVPITITRPSLTKEAQRHGHDRIHHGYDTVSMSILSYAGVARGIQDVQLRSKVTRGTALLALASIPTAVSALTVTTATAAEPAPPLTTTLLTHHAAGRRVRPLLLDVRSRDNLGGEVEPLPEVVETLGGHGVVVVPPAVLRLDEATRGQGLHRLDDEQVLGLDGGVLDLVVLGGDEDAIAEEGL